jgi:DNA polymerase
MLFVELPSGRRLSYVRPRLVEGEYGKKLQYWGVNQETKKWGLVDTYGGKLTENIVQAIARDCLAETMLALDAENYKICIHIHDEVVIETPVENAERELENICKTMGREIPWAKGLPLSAAGYLTPYYKKD